jgi:hypothetical protein
MEERFIEIDLNSDAFDYAGTLKVKSVVDWDKLQYNSTYNSPEYFRNKFPEGFDYLPGFENILERIASNAKTPYEEMISRGATPTMYPNEIPTATNSAWGRKGEQSSGIAEIILSSNIKNDEPRNDTNFPEFKKSE